jgi:hypothetical protein
VRFGLGQGLGGGVETGVPDLFETVGEYVLNEPPKEGDRMEADLAPTLGPEGDLLGSHV